MGVKSKTRVARVVEETLRCSPRVPVLPFPHPAQLIDIAIAVAEKGLSVPVLWSASLAHGRPMAYHEVSRAVPTVSRLLKEPKYGRQARFLTEN